LPAKGAANLISYRGVRRITAKIKTVICEQAPNHGSYFAYARLIARVNSQVTVQLKLSISILHTSFRGENAQKQCHRFDNNIQISDKLQEISCN